jgi:hypothetical protein
MAESEGIHLCALKQQCAHAGAHLLMCLRPRELYRLKVGGGGVD